MRRRPYLSFWHFSKLSCVKSFGRGLSESSGRTRYYLQTFTECLSSANAGLRRIPIFCRWETFIVLSRPINCHYLLLFAAVVVVVGLLRSNHLSSISRFPGISWSLACLVFGEYSFSSVHSHYFRCHCLWSKLFLKCFLQRSRTFAWRNRSCLINLSAFAKFNFL